jgi:hypothetical protein
VISVEYFESELTNIDGLDSDALFNMSGLRVVANFVGDDFRLAKGIHERCTSSAGCTFWPRHFHQQRTEATDEESDTNQQP